MRVVGRRVYRTGDTVQAVLVFHPRPYSAVIYGDDEYDLPEGVVKGSWLPDGEWEALRQQVHRDAEEWSRG